MTCLEWVNEKVHTYENATKVEDLPNEREIIDLIKAECPTPDKDQLCNIRADYDRAYQDRKSTLENQHGVSSNEMLKQARWEATHMLRGQVMMRYTYIMHS